MNPEMPPAGPPPAEPPPPRPHIEVQAEPARAEDRGPVINAPPPVGAPPPPRDPPGGASSSPAPPPQRNTGWAALCHLIGLIDFGFPFLLLGLIGSMVVWLIKKDEDAEVDWHGKEAINFQISMLIWLLVSTLLLCCVIGLPMLVVLPFVKVVLHLIAGVKAANGERWRYPLTVRFVN
jgi:uncharacterized Tic20 family protein